MSIILLTIAVVLLACRGPRPESWIALALAVLALLFAVLPHHPW